MTAQRATTRMDAANRRIVAVDATRGAVMIFSCLAHFAWWIHPAYPVQSDLLSGIGMIATPTFLMISGAMVGMLCARSAERGTDLKSQFFNRGLFLLTIGHLLIALAEAHSNGGLSRTMPGVTVVDEIGLCTLTVAFFVPQVGKAEVCRRLALVAAVVMAVTWLVNLYWMPHSMTELNWEAAVIGGEVDTRNYAIHAPVVQHIGIYLLGLPVGHYFARAITEQTPVRKVAWRFAAAGAVLAGTALVLRALRPVFDAALPGRDAALDATLKITQKIPPSPAYLLFYGGCGLMLVAAKFYASGSARSWVHATLAWFAAIGRASLAVFILQYFLYWTLPDLIQIHPNRWALGFFVANVLVIRGMAEFWGRVRGNRWLTFGIKLARTA